MENPQHLQVSQEITFVEVRKTFFCENYFLDTVKIHFQENLFSRETKFGEENMALY